MFKNKQEWFNSLEKGSWVVSARNYYEVLFITEHPKPGDTILSAIYRKEAYHTQVSIADIEPYQNEQQYIGQPEKTYRSTPAHKEKKPLEHSSISQCDIIKELVIREII